MALTKVTEGIRTLGTDEVIATNIATDAVTTGKILDDNVTIAKISGSASAAADTFLKKDGTWSAVASGIEWQVVQTTGFTAVAEKGYPCNTTAAAFTVTLPSSASVGDQISIVDYAGTFDTNKLTIDPNGLNLKGATTDVTIKTDREGITLTYVDVTQGWVGTSGVNTGGIALNPTVYSADFLVIAGGGSGGSTYGGGGGAGGYRNSFSSETSGGGGPSETSLTFNIATVYTIAVGAGGTTSNNAQGNPGVNSSISGSDIATITSNGGGSGGQRATNGGAGGSGGGPGDNYYGGHGVAGAGTANQGYNSGNSTVHASYYGAGGGGAGAVGANSNAGATGGNGVASLITGGSVTRTGGGGGGNHSGVAGGAGGSGGGGTGGGPSPASGGTVNTGSGGGGAGDSQPVSGAGGSGVVILSMLDADYSGTTTGSPTVATGVSGRTVLTFNGNGSYTA